MLRLPLEGRVRSGRGCGRDSTDLTQLQGSFLVSWKFLGVFLGAFSGDFLRAFYG